MESVNNENGGGGGGGGGKRKIEDAVELAKQKAQAIAARLLSDADSKRPRLYSDSPDFSSPSFPSTNHQYAPPNVPGNYATPTQTNGGGVPSSKKIVIPNAKVGVIIGRGGEMIKNLQLESGARIQITRDADSDPNSLTRDVELMGTQDQIAIAEQRIHQVIAETDATSSVSSGNRASAPPQAGGDQFVMKVPNDKVALVIGKGGETIKMMQTKSGARIQVVPLHLPPGDASVERNIFINGTQEQIDAAKELLNEVISG
ncbi:Far upstream element-binding protein 1, partial [Bienertia sinuspersici]